MIQVPEAGGPGATSSATMVRALTAQPVALRWLNFRERVAISMWFVPLMFAFAALVLSSVGIWIDNQLALHSALLPGTTSGSAEQVSATIASGMLAFTAVVFATTLVAIQLAGGQYSPRIVRVFVRSRLTHCTLGVFLATSVFAINTLGHTRDGANAHVPVVTVSALYVLVLVTLVMFVVFANGIVHLLRVQYLLRIVTQSGRETIERFIPTERAYQAASAPIPSAAPVLLRNQRHIGVLMSVDILSLAGLAAQARCWIELVVQPGEYLAFGTPVALVHGGDGGTPGADAVLRHMLVGPERTLVQDPGFALRQLVDVASRALSPAVNDPTTAVQVIDRIVDLLSICATRPDPSGWYVDAQGVVRVRVPELGFARLAELGFTEIALYGAGAPQVVRRLRAAYDVLEELVGPDRRATVETLRHQLTIAARDAVPPAFTEISSRPDRLGLG
jgi:uncharacterized membrane protein